MSFESVKALVEDDLRQVDAVIGAFRNFELNQLEIEGLAGRCFYPEEEGVPAYDELIYVANPETLDEDKIGRFLAATEKATQYIVNHPEAAWEIFAGSAPELQDELNEKAWADTVPRFALRPAALEYFQINVGKLCNMTCRHCHVDAGPDRKEIMTRETMQLCLYALAQSPQLTALLVRIDIVGIVRAGSVIAIFADGHALDKAAS